MPVYLLCRDNCPLGIAIVAVLSREPIIRWLTGQEEVVYGFIDDREFERARLHPDAIVISERFPPHRGEIAIAFGPRAEWPGEFADFEFLHPDPDDFDVRTRLATAKPSERRG